MGLDRDAVDRLVGHGAATKELRLDFVRRLVSIAVLADRSHDPGAARCALVRIAEDLRRQGFSLADLQPLYRHMAEIRD